MKINVGVVGCGSISRFHFSGLEKAGAQISWVCDLNKKTAQPWADKFGAKYTADYRDIINDPTVNTINVTAMSSAHKMICLDAISASKSIICEKTLATNADDALEIISAAKSKGTIFYTSYMKRFIPAVQQAKVLLPSMGRIISTSIRAYQHWGNLWEGVPKEGFFSTPTDGTPSNVVKNYGGGILVMGGSHILDLICFLLGRPSRLYSSMHYPEGSDFDVQAAALLETDNGIVHYEALAHPLYRIGFLRDGWDERVEINGTNGRLEIYSAAWDQHEHRASMLIHYDNATGNATEYRYDTVSPFDRAIAFFCDNISKRTQGTQPITTGYDVDELISHITQSGKTHLAMDVNYRI